MKIKFWGVRGSLPTPLTGDQIKAKINAVLSRVTEKDVKSQEAKMRFISMLPDWLYGTVGGNTACVELRTKTGDVIILDAGTGLRAFSQLGKHPQDLHYHMFMSHLHWDHMQGFPFFGQSFNPKTKIDIYSPFENAEESFEKQSSIPFFPPNGCWKFVKNQITFHTIKEGEPFELCGMTVNSKKMVHPGGSCSYSFVEDGKKFIYATDVELQEKDFDTSVSSNFFFKDADVIVLDSQYTRPEAIKKVNWGHNSFTAAIEFAKTWKCRNLYLFHHEPTYDDKKLESILTTGIDYSSYHSSQDLNIFLAKECQEVEVK